MDNLLKGAILAEKIDWIAYSQAVSLEWGFPDYIDQHWKAVSPLRNYTDAQENKQGVRRYWNTETPTQGRYVVLPGAASGILLAHQFEFLQWVNTTDRKPTRIDFALDILHSRLTPNTVRKHLLNGEAVTHAKSMLRTGEILHEGDTQYVGRKTSETYTRIYDKAVEQKMGFPWIRIETVYQGNRALPSLKAYCECKSVRPLIKRHINFPDWGVWKKIMSGDVVKLATPQRITATRAWLLSQVATAMARELIRDEEHIFWFEFRDAVAREIERTEGRPDFIDF